MTKDKATISELLYDRGVNHLFVAKNIIELNGYQLDARKERKLQDKIKEYETDEKIKICEGFQTAGIEEPHPSTLLSCGRALLSMNETIDIDTCPSTDAPLEPLAYRAECVPGTKSAILSSIRPLKVKVACDTIDIYSSLFDHFPVVIETECAVNEVGNDTYKTLLPQIQLDD